MEGDSEYLSLGTARGAWRVPKRRISPLSLYKTGRNEGCRIQLFFATREIPTQIPNQKTFSSKHNFGNGRRRSGGDKNYHPCQRHLNLALILTEIFPYPGLSYRSLTVFVILEERAKTLEKKTFGNESGFGRTRAQAHYKGSACSIWLKIEYRLNS